MKNKVNDYTQAKYYELPDDLGLKPSELPTFYRGLKAQGLKPEDMPNKQDRDEYAKFLAENK
jgi:hypothetical protein